ncbi:hypothetical protein BH23PLA1_BH23PLA1_01300 [soil metagenome]
MPDNVSCPACGNILRTAESPFSRDLKCLQCGEEFTAPPSSMSPNPYAAPATSFQDETSLDGAGRRIDRSTAVPATVSGKFAEALRLLLAHLPLFGALVLTFWLPANLYINYVAWHDPNVDEMFLFRAGSLFGLLLGPFVTASVIHALAGLTRGESVGYVEALKAGIHHWGRLFGTRLAVSILIGFGLIALIVPGILLALRYALAELVVVLEEAGPGRSMQRSAQLTWGRRGAILGAGLLFAFALLPIAILLQLPQELAGGWGGMWLATIIDCLTDVLALLLIILMFLFYQEARTEEARASDPKSKLEDFDEDL